MASACPLWPPGAAAEALGAWCLGASAAAALLAGPGAGWLPPPGIRGADGFRCADEVSGGCEAGCGTEDDDVDGEAEAEALMRWIHADISLRNSVRALKDMARLRATFRGAMLRHLKDRDPGPGAPITLLVCKTPEQAARCESLRALNDTLEEERVRLSAELMRLAKTVSPDGARDLEVMCSDMHAAFGRARREDRDAEKAWHIVHPEAEEEFWKSQNRLYLSLLSALRDYLGGGR